jgi:hypothetical protein
MMMESIEACVFQTREESKNRPAVLGMPVDDGALFGGKRRLLFKIASGTPTLPMSCSNAATSTW